MLRARFSLALDMCMYMAVTIVYCTVAVVITPVEAPLLPASETVFSPALLSLKNFMYVLLFEPFTER